VHCHELAIRYACYRCCLYPVDHISLNPSLVARISCASQPLPSLPRVVRGDAQPLLVLRPPFSRFWLREIRCPSLRQYFFFCFFITRMRPNFLIMASLLKQD